MLRARMIAELEDRMTEMSMMGLQPVLLVSPELRRPVRNLAERFLPQLMVISHKSCTRHAIHSEGRSGPALRN